MGNWVIGESGRIVNYTRYMDGVYEESLCVGQLEAKQMDLMKDLSHSRRSHLLTIVCLILSKYILLC